MILGCLAVFCIECFLAGIGVIMRLANAETVFSNSPVASIYADLVSPKAAGNDPEH